MSPSLLSALQQCGWQRDRCINISHWRAMFARHDITLSSRAEEVLTNFGGLTIQPVKSPQDVYASNEISFTPQLDFEADRIWYWQDHLRKKLTPIAHVRREELLLVAHTDETYVMWDRFLWFIGPTFIEALDHSLVHAKQKPVEVLIPENG